MIVSEEEAAKMWCPHARAVWHVADAEFIAGYNRLGGSDAGFGSTSCCIGRKCMAWRPVDGNDSGYCGLAGRT